MFIANGSDRWRERRALIGDYAAGDRPRCQLRSSRELRPRHPRSLASGAQPSATAIEAVIGDETGPSPSSPSTSSSASARRRRGVPRRPRRRRSRCAGRPAAPETTHRGSRHRRTSYLRHPDRLRRVDRALELPLPEERLIPLPRRDTHSTPIQRARSMTRTSRSVGGNSWCRHQCLNVRHDSYGESTTSTRWNSFRSEYPVVAMDSRSAPIRFACAVCNVTRRRPVEDLLQRGDAGRPRRRPARQVRGVGGPRVPSGSRAPAHPWPVRGRRRA